MTAASTERLNRFLARRGVASRRAADALISAGRVTVNGRRGSLGGVVDAASDRVAVDGRPVAGPAPPVTLALNKPAGVVSTRRDPQRRPTVMSLVEPLPGLVPIGRLDADTRGLLLLTTDGDLAHRVSHPRFGVSKRYAVTAAAAPSAAQLAALRRGVTLHDGPVRPRRVERGDDARLLEITLGEGRKREVRRLCAAVGVEVVDLVRLAVGPVTLGRLAEGRSRRLSVAEDASLRRVVGLGGVVVAVDGPVGSGKSTLGSRLAAQLRLPFVDTGLFYRGVTVAAARAGVDHGDARGLAAVAAAVRLDLDTSPRGTGPPLRLDGHPVSAAELHDARLAPLLAAVSAVPGVRSALLEPQRAAAGRGAVAVGRDCGTVVFPDAALKIFLDAPADVRERRRAAQLRAHGHDVEETSLGAEVGGRDRADATRSDSPLRRAPDAHVIDTAACDATETLRRALELCAAAGITPL